jgi:hypothetical protein
MIGKILLVSGIAYGILLGMGDYFEFVIYLRSIVFLIFIGTIIVFLIKGLKSLVAKAKRQPNEINIRFKGI